jgi:uncharacterized membrane protein
MNSKTKNIIGWVLTGLLALAFLMAGAAKLSGQAEMLQSFEKWGLPSIAMYLIGFAEVLGAVGLFIPKTRFLAVLGLMVLMIGAIGTHLLNGEQFIPPLVLLILLSALGWLRKPIKSNL